MNVNIAKHNIVKILITRPDFLSDNCTTISDLNCDKISETYNWINMHLLLQILS